MTKLLKFQILSYDHNSGNHILLDGNGDKHEVDLMIDQSLSQISHRQKDQYDSFCRELVGSDVVIERLATYSQTVYIARNTRLVGEPQMQEVIHG